MYYLRSGRYSYPMFSQDQLGWMGPKLEREPWWASRSSFISIISLEIMARA